MSMINDIYLTIPDNAHSMYVATKCNKPIFVLDGTSSVVEVFKLCQLLAAQHNSTVFWYDTHEGTWRKLLKK